MKQKINNSYISLNFVTKVKLVYFETNLTGIPIARLSKMPDRCTSVNGSVPHKMLDIFGLSLSNVPKLNSFE